MVTRDNIKVLNQKTVDYFIYNQSYVTQEKKLILYQLQLKKLQRTYHKNFIQVQRSELTGE